MMDLQFILSILAIIVGAVGTVKIIAAFLAGLEKQSSDLNRTRKQIRNPRVYSNLPPPPPEPSKDWQELDEWKKFTEETEDESSGEDTPNDDLGSEEDNTPQKPEPVVFIPYEKCQYFTGRDDILSAIELKLKQQNKKPEVIIIEGPRGVGKTTLVVEYLYQHIDEYELIWWIRATDSILANVDYNKLANHLGMNVPPNTPSNFIRDSIKANLTNRGKWVLVFDDVECKDDVSCFIPGAGDGVVIIICRTESDIKLLGSIRVHPFSHEQAIKFISARTDRSDEEVAEELAEALGYIPLALEQAGAYIKDNVMSVRFYLKTLREHQRKLLADGMLLNDTTGKIAPIIDISLDSLEKKSIVSAELLKLCSIFADCDIPSDFLYDCVHIIPSFISGVTLDAVKINQALDLLKRWSMIQMKDGDLSIHQLVVASISERMSDKDRLEKINQAIKIIDAFMTKEDVESPIWRDDPGFIRHALAVLRNAEGANSDPGILTRLYNETGISLREFGALNEAKEMLNKALECAEAAYGPSHPWVAVCAGNCASVLCELGDLEEARAKYEMALTIDRSVYGPGHPNVAMRENDLGAAFAKQGELQAAKECFERALRANEAIYSSNHAKVAADLNRLGNIQLELGEYKEAQVSFQRALRIIETLCSTNDPRAAEYYSNLGRVYKEMGDVKTALSYYERAYKIEENALGPKHPNVAKSANNIGSLLQSAHEYEEAIEYFNRAIEIIEESFGPGHPGLATPLYNLSVAYQELGELETARDCIYRALKIEEYSTDTDDQVLIGNLRLLSNILAKLGDYDEARNCLFKSLELMKRKENQDQLEIESILKDIESLPTAA